MRFWGDGPAVPLAEGLLFEDWGESTSGMNSGGVAQEPLMDADHDRSILQFPGVRTSAPVESAGQVQDRGPPSGGGDPPRSRKRKPKKLPTFLNERESEDLIAAAARRVAAAKGPLEEVAARRDLEAVRFGVACGLRVAELCSIRVEDLDLETWMATVVQGKGAKDRRLPIPRRIQADLAAWVGDRTDGYLFPGPGGRRLSPRTFQVALKALAESAGLKKRVTPHTLRHSFATQTLARKASVRVVQELLGHDSLATTQKYTHVLPEHLRGAVDW